MFFILIVVSAVAPVALACFTLGNVQCSDGRCWCPSNHCGPGRMYQRYYTSSNGCGGESTPVAMWSWDVHCCDSHDHCYATAGTTRDYCDEIFCSCLSGWSVGWWCGIADQRTFISDSYFHDSQRDYVGCYNAPSHWTVNMRTRHKGRRLEMPELPESMPELPESLKNLTDTEEWMKIGEDLDLNEPMCAEDFHSLFESILAPKTHGEDGEPEAPQPAMTQVAPMLLGFTIAGCVLLCCILSCITYFVCAKVKARRVEPEQKRTANGDIHI